MGHQGRRTGGTEFIYHSAEGRGGRGGRGSQFRRVKERKRKGRHKDGEKRRGKSSCLRNCAVTAAAAAAPYCSNALLRILPSCRHSGAIRRKHYVLYTENGGESNYQSCMNSECFPPPSFYPPSLGSLFNFSLCLCLRDDKNGASWEERVVVVMSLVRKVNVARTKEQGERESSGVLQDEEEGEDVCA